MSLWDSYPVFVFILFCTIPILFVPEMFHFDTIGVYLSECLWISMLHHRCEEDTFFFVD